MCYHVSQQYPIEEIEEAFEMEAINEDKYTTGYQLNGFAKVFLPVITKDRPEVIDMYQWKLTPHWVKEGEIYKANTLNARNDELFVKPSYKSYWRNRCLIIVSGFFEPRDRELAGLPGPASPLQKTESWYIKHATDKFLTLGGIYCNGTVSIITTDASPMMEEVHNDGKRMPLIIDDPELRDRWVLEDMDQKGMAAFMNSHPDDSHLIAFRTIDGIFNNKVDTNIPEALMPLT